MLNLDHLKEFIEVAKCLSFSEAAKITYTSAPSLSRHIRQLEAEVGYALFDRDAHSVKLTSRGLDFMRRVESILIEIENLLDSDKLFDED